ncbi:MULTISPECIES: hypothetical protein [Giesbergeria]|uniref:Uncharacterized protein n=1 Tax=Giesbergeria sinuosa TaxID=80883 RepID=A0ABV9QDM0_9BURK
MQDWRCSKGESLLIPSGPSEKRHLFAILLDPCRVEGRGSKPHVLLASVLSIKPGMFVDDSCLLKPGDHPFIRHDSFIDYRFTRLEQAEHVEARVAEGVFDVKESCSPDLIRRIIEGALKSPRIPREYKMILKNQL